MSHRGNRGRGQSGASGQPRGGRQQPRGGERGGGFSQGRAGAPRGGQHQAGGPRAGPPPAQLALPPLGPAPPIEQRLASNVLDALTASFRQMQVTDSEMPLRPGWGTIGKPLTLLSNFFALRLPKGFAVYDYEVIVTPDDLRGPGKARIFELLERSAECAPYMGYVAHDRSKRLVSSTKLVQPLRVDVAFVEDGVPPPESGPPVYKVEIKFQRAMSLADVTPHLDGQDRGYDTAPLISALNLMLQKHAMRSGAIRFGRDLEDEDEGESEDSGKKKKKSKKTTRGNKFFFPTTESFPLVLGLEARRGYFMSVRPLYKQLAVNINVSMAAFYVPGNLAQAMIAFRNQVGSLPQWFSYQLKVGTQHLGYPRKHTILRVMNSPASKTTFPCDEFKRTVTVEEFFRLKYNITLKFAENLPVIDVGKRGKKPIYLPAEICDVLPGQMFKGKLSPDATREMIKFASNRPDVNRNFIENEGLSLLGLRGETEILKAMGLQVNPQMTAVPARRLPAPGVTYKSGSPDVRDASWNILKIKFHEPADLSSWAVLLVQEGRRGEFGGIDDPQLASFLNAFKQKCRDCGLKVADPKVLATPRLPRVDRNDPGRRNALATIETTLKKGLNLSSKQTKPSLVLILLSDVDDFIYPGLKRMCDMQLGLLTTHMLLTPKKARVPDSRKQDQYFSNVALKVNAKLGGINHMLAENDTTLRWLRQKKTMLVGIDVTHPSPGSALGTPSIVAVVGSVDDRFVQFPVSMALQRNRNVNKNAEEMVQELTKLLVERLQAYEKKMRQLPERIIVCRDGVSEGQYDLVRERELPRILEAFEKFNTKSRGKPYKPSLTIIVCGKRHHARFPGTSPDHIIAKTGNTVPGMVVDKGVTDIYNFDFYLQAHNGLQGTVRPTHYTVVHDENQLDADTVELFTHNLSYLYARATKAVSLVPPAYYADIACERARLYLNTLMNLSDDNKSTSSRRNQEEERERVYKQAEEQWGVGVHPDLKDSMLYI